MKSRIFYLMVVLLGISCTREENVLPDATFPTTAEVFTDVPVGLTDQFFRSFDPADGANTGGFGVDENEFFEGSASIKIAVPSATDEDGTFIGGIFEDRGQGRNLTQYNALTFYAKSSITATAGVFGFGDDFDQSRFVATITDVPLTTNWKKYFVPIPDPSKLLQEKGMFVFAAGSQSTGGVGYTFWMDEIKFESLTSVAQPEARIANGDDLVLESFNTATIQVPSTSVVYNVDGDEVNVNAGAAYFNFSSTNESVATVDANGLITVLSGGVAVITATIGEGSNQRNAIGSITINSIGDFELAPVPTVNPVDVISIFSDAYTSQAGFNLAAFNNGGIQIQELLINNDNILGYSNLSFVGLGWTSPIDVSTYDFLHLDIQVSQTILPGQNFVVEIIDFGANGTDDGAPFGNIDDTAGGITILGSNLTEGEWVGVDIPVNGFIQGTGGGGAGSPNLDNVARIALVGAAGISNILVDNVYFYRD